MQPYNPSPRNPPTPGTYEKKSDKRNQVTAIPPRLLAPCRFSYNLRYRNGVGSFLNLIFFLKKENPFSTMKVVLRSLNLVLEICRRKKGRSFLPSVMAGGVG